MKRLDLREIRCPLALVLLKQQLLTLETNHTLEVLFVDQAVMQDILLYLNKKNYTYNREKNKLFVTL
ncbi:sulfurtransferase TusA family protein [Psychromonas algicola]|uniref:sulfurtransferase TusA family protein n=1 Tax=Psychromonas algicola TaxID=2555642 RepID=UPI001419236C|nr:sulfurtransferase TusA family protein [Psychromonas sp. RZ5]